MKTTTTKRLLLLAGMWLFPFLLMGQNLTETRDTGPFTGVSTSGSIGVMLSQGDTYSVAVEAGDGIISDVVARVRNDVLELEYSGSLKRIDKITVYVTAPEYLSLQASGAGSFTSMHALSTPSLQLSGNGASSFKLELATENLLTRISGATNATLSGRATRHELHLSGASMANAYGLETEVSENNLSGASTARVLVNTMLKAETSGSSRLTFRGNPASREIYSSGVSRVTSADSSEPIATSDGDTVVVRMGQREIQVIDGEKHRTNVHIKRRPSRSFTDNWSGFELGINGFLSPDNKINLPTESEQFDLDYKKSISVNLNLWQQNLVLINRHLGIVTGLGISWNNYRFETNDVMIKGPQQVEFTEGLHDYKKNKLTTTYLNVPLLLEFQTAGYRQVERFHLSAGINAGLRIGSHTKQMVFLNDKREKFKDHKDFYLNPFRFDATARIGWGRVNLFASYALNSLFKEDKGPELIPFSVGVRLVSF